MTMGEHGKLKVIPLLTMSEHGKLKVINCWLWANMVNLRLLTADYERTW